ncbi:hypothetical protein [Emticicia sp. C21]|uniref:hypothetical protein n=1 Tax=Emticicia sp. C21 TaxID=2302915 RepID=UPI000E353700|nr:hypothetical protein [Emticicia sp. C21]RFS17766.1 hypothetical protein D0T08_00510 [Emticicia sp. C21]
MKYLFCLILISCSLSGFFQDSKTKIPSVWIEGITIKKGDSIKLGKGSGNKGTFTYIITEDTKGIPAMWTNKRLIVEDVFKAPGNDSVKYSISLKTSPKTKFTISDLYLALQQNEIVAVNKNAFY